VFFAKFSTFLPKFLGHFGSLKKPDLCHAPCLPFGIAEKRRKIVKTGAFDVKKLIW
jgi:hypothetical protein